MEIGLILEGGGNRGVYTAGVLDVLMQNQIYLPITYAVSAGACNAMSYLSKQEKRSYRIFTEYASDKRYSSWMLYLKTGSLFGFDFIFRELSDNLLPFDYDEFYGTSMRLKIFTTDCETAKPVVFTNKDMDHELRPLIATSSLPVIANIVEFQGHKLLDGCVAAPIPIDHAIRDGVTKNIIILTRDRTYSKPSKPDFPPFLVKWKYKKYPELVSAILQRYRIYQAERELCYQEQEKGNAVVIQPSSPIVMKRQCRDSSKMKEIYQMGVRDASERLTEIKRFITVNS